MPWSRHGRQRAARHLAAADDRVALAGDAGAGQHERHELLARCPLALRPDDLRADEARVLLAAPAEAGLDRPAVLGQVVAVEVEADLEAQRVAGAEADGRGAASVSASQTAVACSGAMQQLDAVLAGVAGAGDEDVRRARDGQRRRAESLRQLAVARAARRAPRASGPWTASIA